MYAGNAATVRRIDVLTRILRGRPDKSVVRGISGINKVTIDGVSKVIKPSSSPEFIPRQYLRQDAEGFLDVSQTILHHLRWMLQKDNLGQDIFLLGRPGPLRRNVAMQFIELTQRELEYVALSRDTTESDLKQRREIESGTAKYHDQSAVRAAINGRVLVIEGVEKAERNVLPVLNNLLENREMNLEDGRLLIPAERYDKLMEQYGAEELRRWGLVRVSEDFRVIALGLPVPKYRGAPLDPPLRSRFQARDVTNLSYQEIFSGMRSVAPNADPEKLRQILSFGFAIQQADAKTNLPDFPIDSAYSAAKILNNNKSLSAFDVIYRLYPYRSFMPKESHEAVNTLLKSLNIKESEVSGDQEITHVHSEGESVASVTVSSHRVGNVVVAVPSGGRKYNLDSPMGRFVSTGYQNNLLADVMQSFAVGDVCLLGPKGCGKSALVMELCNLLGQSVESMVLYQDMTGRDLIQQRTTKINGDTIWRDSALLRAALAGRVAVLDGIHRIHNSTVSILHRLVHDRELQLYDGRRLVSHERFDDLLAMGATPGSLEAKGVLRIHPSFRIVALAEPPVLDTGANWLTPEMLSLFTFHEVRNLSQKEEIHIINSLYGEIGPSLEKILNLAQFLRDAKDPIMKNLAGTLSTRQLLRIAHRMSVYPPEKVGIFAKPVEHPLNSAYETIQRTFLAKFLPALPRATLESVLERFKIHQRLEAESGVEKTEIEVANGRVRIGKTDTEVYRTDAVTKVPDILFYDVPQHVVLMEHLLQDFLIGNHLLLVGNQGVGKNKIADRLLQVMNRPREYIQLHRDTTVQTLTLQPAIKDGIVTYEDSPLVKAVKNGHVLVVDEADKAPTHVTCILKTLVENGEMILSDGRKILPAAMAGKEQSSPDVIYAHRDFRMIVLANRPGFPFLGNDFFASLGDLFSCHSVDNPSTESEIFLLQQYGPDVPRNVLDTLVRAFAELRSMADVGQLSYPYSTREVVNIVKHLQRFPSEDMSELVGNVLDFDRYSPEALELVTSVLQKHGLPIEGYARHEMAALRKKREIQVTVESKSGKSVSGPKHGKVDPKNDPHVGGNTWAGGSGGRDTAGLGGKGGPYRLDSGNPVHQLSDEEKDDIPDEVKKAAREMNRRAYEERLREIKMSTYDHSVYEEYSLPVQKQVKELRVVLNALQAKSKERHWQKHQTTGELDDTKLVEGITGEKNIYRRRAEQEPEPGQPQEKPKRLKLVVDVSGSMYRFNGYDGRLDREMEAVVLVMEAFEGFAHKVEYDIVGHSGETYYIPFVDAKKPPKDDRVRLETIKMMHAHAQYCWSGDHTLLATNHAVDQLAQEECDEAIVVVLSDANLQRYGISPAKVAQALQKREPKVQAYVIFIGSIGEEAEIINQKMPPGRSFVCMDLAQLPQILKQIFTSSVLYQSAL
ncbi:von Willebrand factor A domain-containing protein 8 [Phlebotomus argentipes]|uniref:von Willebrand factor A domain-containing protein 8 n=1 Tax=Phlebotomus argentipes TaxID=94469 RepID=UPI0028936B7F|nr:von Willebrand factor A domain-containing protein 8 [Phlebotomus argentipes]